MTVSVSEIDLSPGKAQLLHRLAAGQRLLRQASTLRFIVGTPEAAYNSVIGHAAEALIDYRLVDNQGPLDGTMFSPTLFLINDRGREWCVLHPQQIEDDTDGDPAKREIDVEALSDEAQNMLLNADARVGGSLGIGDPRTREETHRELQILGLIGDKGFLTRRGRDVARGMQIARWDETSI